jgi:hypothetical protein
MAFTPNDPTGIAALDEVDLQTLDAKGNAPRPSRLSSAAAGRGLFQSLLKDDEASAIRRVRVQGMKDGDPPYNQAALNASGQGSRANANFLLGQDLITKANAGYNDMFLTPKQLVTLDVEGGEPSARLGYSRIIASEVTRTFRKWKNFVPNALRLVDLFTTHGVSNAYFPDTKDFRFRAAGFGDFLIPRMTEVGEDNILYAGARRDMTVVELYEPIQNPEKAEKAGWNVDAVKKAIGKATTQSATGQIGDYEKFQTQIKNNDVHANRQFAHVPVVHMWVREFDGTISFFIFEKDGDGDFLFHEYSRYMNAEEAFVFFCYGIGNGTYHSIRGMGQMIFALVQLHNRLMCQKADGTMLDESIMMQATSGNALQEASINYLGPLSLLAAGFEVVDTKRTASSDRTLPFLREVKSLMGQTSSRFMAPAAEQGVYQNKDQTDFALESVASGDTGAVDLFYVSLDRLFRQSTIRLFDGPKSDPLVREFHQRLEKAGITPDILKSVDRDSIYAFRAIGAGSPAARSLTFKSLLQILPQLDEIGRRNLIYEFVADLVGYQNADIFASKAEEPRQNSDAGLAELENILLEMGNEIPVLDYQMDASHVGIHIPKLIELLDGVENGQLDPMEKLPALQAFLNHVTMHGEKLASDPTQKELYGQVREAINNLNQVVVNMERKIKAAQRQEVEAGAPAADGTQLDPAAVEANSKARLAEIRIATEEFKFNLAQEKGRLELAAIQAKIDQNLALNDAKAAQSMQDKLMYPRSDSGMRA